MNKTKCFFLACICCLLASFVKAEGTYRTQITNAAIKSLQVKAPQVLISEPYIDLEGSHPIEISFDALHEGYTDYVYTVIHCDADWNKSSLVPLEYMDGFQQMIIEDYATPLATTTQYTNYRLLLPNEDVQLKVSGNYAVQISRQDTPDKPVLTACFSVIEPLIEISALVSSNTDIDTNNKHQQVSFTIHTEEFPIAFPQNDLKIKVKQNGRTDNEVTHVQPMNISSNQIVYNHRRELIFEAGNEFRRFEFLTHRYNGMAVEQIKFFNPYYHVLLQQQESRRNRGYTYDQDQNGRFFIRCSNCSEPDEEADYYIVHFSLNAINPFPGEVYISGELFHNQFSEENRMEYNKETRRYEKAALLKQGNYNYQYLHVPPGASKGQTQLTEGDYYQTENEYTILIYYRPMGARFDRLIGKKTIANKQLTL